MSTCFAWSGCQCDAIFVYRVILRLEMLCKPGNLKLNFMNMKKMVQSVLCCLAFSTALNAQILNPGFELSRPDGTTANWDPHLILVFNPNDTTGPCFPDSACYRTGDSYTGKKALVLQNLACDGELVYGRVFASDDIPAYAPSAPFALRPDYISFYYKCYPKAGEGIHMEAIVSDANGIIASADTIFYPGTVSNYAQMKVPIQYLDATQPERIFLRFSLIDASGGYGDMLPGSKVFLDEIQTGNNITGIATVEVPGTALHCYPVPAGDWVDIGLKDNRPGERYTLQVTDITGKVIYRQESVVLSNTLRVDLRHQAPGIYFVKAGNASQQWTAKFVHIR